jgi:hypothetical protein
LLPNQHIYLTILSSLLKISYLQYEISFSFCRHESRSHVDVQTSKWTRPPLMIVRN